MQEHAQVLLLPLFVDGVLGLRATHFQVAEELDGVPFFEVADGIAVPAVEVEAVVGPWASPMVPWQGREGLSCPPCCGPAR